MVLETGTKGDLRRPGERFLGVSCNLRRQGPEGHIASDEGCLSGKGFQVVLAGLIRKRAAAGEWVPGGGSSEFGMEV